MGSLDVHLSMVSWITALSARPNGRTKQLGTYVHQRGYKPLQLRGTRYKQVGLTGAHEER